MTRLIKEPTVWTNMDGNNNLERKLNSYLTTRFITRQEIPSDECLSEAKEIINIILDELLKK